MPPRPPSPSPPPSVVVRVRRNGALHLVAWRDARLHFLHHRIPTLLMLGALHSPCRCAEILMAIRNPKHWYRLPEDLRQPLRAYKQHREQLGHGARGNPNTLWQNARAHLRAKALLRRFAPVADLHRDRLP